MAFIGYRWRRLARQGNNLMLHTDNKSLLRQAVVLVVKGSKTVVDEAVFRATANPPPDKTGRETLKAYYIKEGSAMPWMETCDVSWRRYVEVGEASYHYPGSKKMPLSNYTTLVLKVPYKRIYERDGGAFPVTGREIPPVHTEESHTVYVYFYDDENGERRVGGGFYDDDGKPYGAEISPDHFTFIEDETAERVPTNDADFVSATKSA